MKVSNLATNDIYENCLKAIVIIFGTISATTMIIFCLSLTQDSWGQAIAAAIGLGIVLSQYVFSAKIQQDKHNGKYDAITIAVTVVIFSVSILGTWSWVESEFNTNNKTSTQTSDRYKDNRTLIAMKTITAQSHINQAQEYTDKGNFPTQAKNSTKEADKVLAEIEVLMQKNDTLPTATTGNSSQDMAIAFGDLRWLPWLVLALIIDVCPVIAILELRRLGAVEVTPNESGTNTTLTSGSGTATDESATLKSDALNDLQSNHHKDWQPAPVPVPVDERYSKIRHCVINQTVKLGKNAIQTKFSLGTKTVDIYFEWLMQENIIKRTEGKRTYELVKEPLNHEKTNDQTMARAT